MPSDSHIMVYNCLYSDSEFLPTCCPFPVSQWSDSFRPLYSGDKPCRNLTGLPEKILSQLHSTPMLFYS